MLVATPLAPKSALRHRSLGSERGTTQPVRVPRASRTGISGETVPPFVQTSPKPTAKSSRSWLTWMGMGMCLTLAAVLLGQLALSAVTTIFQQWQYGYPRTYQCDAVVGHNDSPTNPSHFIALNLHGRIEVMEFPGGNVAQARIYQGPQLFGPGADLVPVTLQFPDPAHTHHPDMLVLFQGTQLVWHNVQGRFQPG
jgi:hypothetical protein